MLSVWPDDGSSLLRMLLSWQREISALFCSSLKGVSNLLHIFLVHLKSSGFLGSQFPPARPTCRPRERESDEIAADWLSLGMGQTLLGPPVVPFTLLWGRVPLLK